MWRQPDVASRRVHIPRKKINTRTRVIIASPATLSVTGLEALFGAGGKGDALYDAGVIGGIDSIKNKTLYDNKGDVLKAIDANGAVTQQEQAIILAIAMQVDHGCKTDV